MARFSTILLISSFIFLQQGWAGDKAHWLDEYRDKTELFNVEGYRVTRYRSPPPDDSEDAQLVSTVQLQELIEKMDNLILLDVLPLSTAQGKFVQRKKRFNIPGSYWLPNVGKGELSEENEAYFRYYLEKITENSKVRPIVMYCRADCWMSWNAVKRARNWGYSNLYWYREGMNGWRDASLKEVESLPEPQLNDAGPQ